MRPSLRLYEYEFELTVKYCLITMRFPCTFSLSWKLEKNTVTDSKKFSPQDNRVDFNSTLVLKGQVLYSEDSDQFLEKKCFLTLNLNSLSRPDDVKVAGVVTIELSKHLNESPNGGVPTLCPLQRCPDKSSQICFQLDFAMVRELRLDEHQDILSLSRLADGLSSIGRGPQSEISEQLDIKQLQFGTTEKNLTVPEDIGSKRVNSLTRTRRMGGSKAPRVSMQMPIGEIKEKVEDEEGSGLRKVRSGDTLKVNKSLMDNASHREVRIQSAQKDLTESNYIPYNPKDADLQRQIDSLKEVNAALEKENDELKVQNIALKRKNNEMVGEHQKLQRQVQELAQKQLKILKESELITEDYKNQVENLKRQLSEVGHEGRMKVFLKQQRQRSADLQSQLKQLQSRIQQYNQQLSNHNTLLNNYYYLQGQCQRLQQQYDHSQQQVWDLTISNKQKQKQLSHLHKNMSNISQNMDQFNELVDENNKLQEYIEQLQGQLEDIEVMFQQQLLQIKAMIEESMVKEESSMKTIGLLEEECRKMMEALGSRSDHIQYFENRLSQLEKEINQIYMAKTSRERSLSFQNQSKNQEESDSQPSKYIFVKNIEIDVSETIKQEEENKKEEQDQLIFQKVLKYQEEIKGLNNLNDLLRSENKELVSVVEQMKRKQQKVDQELEKLRISGLSKMNTEATKQQEHEEVHQKIKHTQCRKIYSPKKDLSLNFLQTVPQHRSEDQISMLKQKVQIQEKVREISIELQKMKLNLIKTAKTTPQVQQLVSAMRPLQERIFQLLSWKKGIMSNGYSKPQ